MNRLLSYFKVERPGEVTWSHGTNSRAALDRACGDPGLMMVEGDISRSASAGEVIMAHPPRDESDLTFRAWMEGVVRAGKGAKLDFKDPSAVGLGRAYFDVVDGDGLPIRFETP